MSIYKETNEHFIVNSQSVKSEPIIEDMKLTGTTAEKLDVLKKYSIKKVYYNETFDITRIILTRIAWDKTYNYILDFSEVKKLAVELIPAGQVVRFANVEVWAVKYYMSNTISFYWKGCAQIIRITSNISGIATTVERGAGTTACLDPLIKCPLELKYGTDRLQLKEIQTYNDTIMRLEKPKWTGFSVSKAKFIDKDTNEELVLTMKDLVKILLYNLSDEFKNNSGLCAMEARNSYIHIDMKKLPADMHVDIKPDEELSIWMTRAGMSNTLDDYYISDGTLRKYVGRATTLSLPPVYYIEPNAFDNSMVEAIKLPSTITKRIKFTGKAINNKKLVSYSREKYRNERNRLIKIVSHAGTEFYDNTSDTGEFKRLLMFNTYEDLRKFGIAFYLDSEYIAQAQL